MILYTDGQLDVFKYIAYISSHSKIVCCVLPVCRISLLSRADQTRGKHTTSTNISMILYSLEISHQPFITQHIYSTQHLQSRQPCLLPALLPLASVAQRPMHLRSPQPPFLYPPTFAIAPHPAAYLDPYSPLMSTSLLKA